jgi:hypothetical protein
VPHEPRNLAASVRQKLFDLARSRKKKLNCGGLQPSELFSATVPDGTDSVRSVAIMESQSPGLPIILSDKLPDFDLT